MHNVWHATVILSEPFCRYDRRIGNNGKLMQVQRLPSHPAEFTGALHPHSKDNRDKEENMYKTSLTAPVFGLRRDIDRLFEDAFGATNNGSAWMPVADIRETTSDLTIEFELPGLKPEEVEITSDNGVLTVSGEKRSERREGNEDGRFHLMERTYGRFSRSFQLPKGINDSEISADFEYGLLRVRIPKTALPQPKKIQIGSSSKGREQAQVSGSSNRGSNKSSASSEQN
jgi:HSP20 family protein